MYSYICKNVKYIPNKIVNNNLLYVCEKFLLINLWWDHVTVIPDVIKMIVFRRGILKGSKILIPFGGQLRPNSNVGVNLEWKNLQKKEIKKKISEVINKIILHFSPSKTCIVWNPW